MSANYQGVAKLDKALGYEPRDYTFESCRLDFKMVFRYNINLENTGSSIEKECIDCKKNFIQPEVDYHMFRCPPCQAKWRIANPDTRKFKILHKISMDTVAWERKFKNTWK